MKNKLLPLLFAITLIGCSDPYDTWIKEENKVKEIHFLYFRDAMTGLCFAMNDYNYYNINPASTTCVPCDSLNKVKVIQANILPEMINYLHKR